MVAKKKLPSMGKSFEFGTCNFHGGQPWRSRFDEPVALPDGVEVRIEIVPSEAEAVDEAGQTLGQKLLRHAGKAVGLPEDFSAQHDHYLYGTPKE